MKMSRIISLLLVLVMLASCFVACGPKDEGGNESGNGSGKETVTIWISEKPGVAELTLAQVNKFIEANPQYKDKYEIKVEGVSEGDAASQVLLDVSSAADIFGFAQDQLARLVQSSALAAPGQNASATITADNDQYSVSAASVGGKLWAYPMTSDNGYYLYYNKSVVKNPADLQAIVDDCKAAGLKFNFELENGWYTASFFFGAGCVSSWETDTAGNFTKVTDDWNSEKGVIAMKGMSIVTQEPDVYNNSSKIEEGIAAVITGTWNAEDAEAYFGENLGVAKLPSFTVDGQTYQLGSFSGFKLMGVKPQTDPEKGAFCSALAQYLTSEACQLERFNSFQWGPSNKAAQNNDAVKANESLLALAAQNAYAVTQGNIPNAWWTSAAAVGAASKTCTDDAAINTALGKYKSEIDAILTNGSAN